MNGKLATVQTLRKTLFWGLITRARLARLAGLVSVCRDLDKFVKCNKNQLCDYMTTGPSRLAEIPVSRCRAEIFPCNHVWQASPGY